MELAPPFQGSSGLPSAKAQGSLARKAVDRILEKSDEMNAEVSSEESMKCALAALERYSWRSQGWGEKKNSKHLLSIHNILNTKEHFKCSWLTLL